MNREGAAAELAAQYFLQRQGMTPLTSNFRSKLGEIDIIMLDGQILVFVEVRRRSSDRYGGAAASISAAKKKSCGAPPNYFYNNIRLISACPADSML